MILAKYTSSLYSNEQVCFLILFHSIFDVGRSMFNVHFFSKPSHFRLQISLSSVPRPKKNLGLSAP